jgi:hypothetical protein
MAYVNIFKFPESYSLPILKFGDANWNDLVGYGLLIFGVILIIAIAITPSSEYKASKNNKSKGKQEIFFLLIM